MSSKSDGGSRPSGHDEKGMTDDLAPDSLDLDRRLCDVCSTNESVAAQSSGARLCDRCSEAVREGAGVAEGYGRFMRRRYERGELKYGPPRTTD